MDAQTAQTVPSREAFEQQVAEGDRFEFGENWRRFLAVLDEDRIAEAERSLVEMLELPSLEGRSFLDLGSGSGLFSLAAMRLGAARVLSIDIDPSSVACTQELRRRYMPDAENWAVERVSILDDSRISTLGEWDVVYSWGVLHHTGHMHAALDRTAALVGPDGRLFISIYNDQGLRSRIWRRIKQAYNALPARLRIPFVVAVMAPLELRAAITYTLVLNPFGYVRLWTEYKRSRGMSRWHDLVDWVGGYPFEVAKPEEIFAFYRARGFTLLSLVTCAGGLGCNQYVFERPS